MKKIIVILVILLAAAAVFFYVFIYGGLSNTATPEPVQPTGKLMSIESYVSQHISELSPEKEVLGGKFYVTGIKVEGGYGTVNYEDGHIALVADFTYTADDVTGIKITSFVVRK